MSAWWLIAPGVLGCLAVLVTAAKLSAGKHPPGRHVLDDPQEAYDVQAAAEWGSMIRDEERAINPSGWLRGFDGVLASTTTNLARDPDDPYDPAGDEPWGWREQTAADLSPEALNDQPDPYLDALAAEYGSEFDDSGPGALSSFTPGPGPDLNGRPTVSGLEGAMGVNAPPVQPTRLADTGDIASAHLLADVQAFMRAQDDDARAYGSAGEAGWHDFMQQYWAGFAEAQA